MMHRFVCSSLDFNSKPKVPPDQGRMRLRGTELTSLVFDGRRLEDSRNDGIGSIEVGRPGSTAGCRFETIHHAIIIHRIS